MKPTASETVSIAGYDLQVHTWEPHRCEPDSSSSRSRHPAPTPRGIVVVYHGFLAHARHPTVRGACELFASHGYQVVSADLPGHGASPGLRGYLPFTAHSVVDVAVAIADYAVSQCEFQQQEHKQARNKSNELNNLRVFLVGSSMGGAIALAAAHRIASASTRDRVTWSDRLGGVVLLAPMLQLSVSEVERRLLSLLTMLVPTWRLVPSHCSCMESQYRDPQKRIECENDKYRYTSDWVRVGSASLCVELTHSVRSLFRNVSVPFLVLVADHDVSVDVQGCWDLMDQSPSIDKHIRRYDALHGILCEPTHRLQTIQRDMIEWIRERT